MPGTSSKKPSSKRITFVLREDFIHFVLSVNDLFIVYTSGLLVVIGALLMLGRIPFEFSQQFTVASLVLAGFLAVFSAIALQFPYSVTVETQSEADKATKRAKNLIRVSGIFMLISWILVVISTVALIVLIWQA